MANVHRVALVTGAASGIGLSVTRALLERGTTVVLVDRSPAVLELAESLQASLLPSLSSEEGGSGARAIAFVADLSKNDEVVRVAQDALASVGVVDILFNNAGIHPKFEGGPMHIAESTIEVWNEVLAVNLTAPFLLSRELLPAMKERGWGRIIMMSSRAGRTVSPLASTSYAATKAGILGLSRTLASEVAPFGITVNSVAPGPIFTAMSETASPERRAALAKTIPVGRYGTTDEITSAVLFLASEEASFITGAVLDVNGGSHMP